MKKTNHTIESLLEHGTTVSLREDEQATLKAALLSYASFHGVSTPAVAHHSHWSSWWMRSAVSIGVFLFLCVGTGAASYHSLPGDFLYPMKTHMLEEAMALTKTSEDGKLSYQLSLIETRLLEIHELNDAGTLTLAALTDVEDALSDSIADIDALFAADTDDSILARHSLAVTTDMVAITQAIDEITTESALTEEGHFADTIESTRTLHNEQLTEFLEKGSTSTITAYIEEQLTEISDELAENDNISTTTADIVDYLADVEEAVAQQAYDQAAVLVGEALQDIKSEEYQTDYEDELLES